MSNTLLNDAIRELRKDLDLLQAVGQMMAGEAAMNAAKHMSTQIMPNPLAAAVGGRLSTLEAAVKRFEGGQRVLPFKGVESGSNVVPIR